MPVIATFRRGRQEAWEVEEQSNLAAEALQDIEIQQHQGDEA